MVAVRLDPMTEPEYAAWVPGEIREYGAEHVRAGDWTSEGASERSEREFHALLPQGVATPGHHLRTVHDAATGAAVGLVWFQAGAPTPPGEVPRAFVFNLFIDAAQRGRGYGAATMRAVEAEVRRLGFTSLGLHVFGHNAVARSLYEKLGYTATNVLMKKALGPSAPP